MHNSHLRAFAGSLPYVLLVAIVAACSANDPGPSAAIDPKNAPERFQGAEDAGGAPSSDEGTFADSSRGGSGDGPRDDEAPSASDAGNASDDWSGDDSGNEDEPTSSDSGNAPNGANGAEPTQASASADRDGDGLSDAVETNTGVFASRSNTGTDPDNWDTDGDGISDGDEVLGTSGGLNLPAMGVNPLRKNILLEYDWFEDNNDRTECAAHSHRPTSAAVNLVSKTFASAPVANPDGSTGITIIHDYGQGGVFTGGNRINDSDGVLSGGVDGSEYLAYRAKNFASNREGYFHYAILPHRYDTDSGSSGQADLPGGNFIVSLYCAGSDYNVASTIVHELGHNLNLRHGGNVDINDKPNYNSVMNYRYQFNGVDTDCTPAGNGVIDYSRNRRITLDEKSLDERLGICGSNGVDLKGNKPVAVDWNGNQSIESGVRADVNGDWSVNVLTDYDDWAALQYDWHGRPGTLSKRSFSEVATCDSQPPHP